MIDCATCRDRLLDWVDDAVDSAVEEHLAACPECAPEAFGLLRTRRLVGAARRQPPPPGLAERIRSEARAAGLIEAPARPRAAWRPPMWAAAAGLLVAAALGWSLGPARTPPESETRVVLVERPEPAAPVVTAPRPAEPERTAPEPVREFWTASLATR